jgi:ribonuclease P protein component
MLQFRPAQRLRRQTDIRAVRESGTRTDCGAFTLWVRRRPEGTPPVHARAGVVASIAAVGDAVARNRAKRRLREVFRRHQAIVPAGWDLLLVARSSVNRWPFDRLEQTFVAACTRLCAHA